MITSTPTETVTTEVKQEASFPICTRCGGELDEIRHLDYGDIRVVYHTELGCVIGVLNVPVEPSLDPTQ